MTREERYKALAQQGLEDEKKNNQRTSHTQPSFDPWYWTGHEKSGQTKLVRLVGGFPDFEEDIAEDSSTGRTIHVAKLATDEKKPKSFVVPSQEEDPTHIFWRLRDTVLKSEWIDDPSGTKDAEGNSKKIRKYIHKDTFPDLVDRFETNGKNKGYTRNKFDKGWKATTFLMFNVIDRERMDEHKELNHTFLLSKSINVADNGNIYANDWGINHYGFHSALMNILQYYPNFTEYDLAITRTGQMGNPFIVKNAGKHIEEVPDNLKELVVNGPLTKEELGFDRYDLGKMFKTSSYSKWYNSFKVLLKQVDLAFNTSFHSEVEQLAKEEREEAQKREEANTPTSTSQEEAPKEEEVKEEAQTSTRRRRKSSTPSTSVTWELLKENGYKGERFFTPQLQELITGFDEETKTVIWKEGLETFECLNEECSLKSPDHEAVEGCILCDESYLED